MHDSKDLSPEQMNSRERIRHLFAQILSGSDAGDASGSPESGSGDGFDDPFGDDLFSERALRVDGGGNPSVMLGDGFDSLGAFGSASGDGHGSAEGEPDWEVSEFGETEYDDLTAGVAEACFFIEEGPSGTSPEPEGPAESTGAASASSAPREASADTSQPESILDSFVDLTPRCASGYAPTLECLPDRPPSGTHRVVVVELAELDRLNEQLQSGWRVIQMLPSGSPLGFVVALRYAGYSA